MIDYQDNKFGIHLETILTSLQTKIQNNTYRANKDIRDSQEVDELKKAIYKRLGIKVKLVTNSILAAVLPFYPASHHIFLNEFWRGRAHNELPDQVKLIKEAEKSVGYVNLDKAQLGGVFSEYENTLYMNFYDLFITYKLTVPETVAVMLHELGHIFYACEYSDRMNTTNQVLAEVTKTLSSKDREKKLNYIFKNLQSINHDITEADVEQIVNGNKIVAGYAFFKVVMGSVASQMKESKYDETSFEQSADNFAARFQYGKPLVTGLDKLMIAGFSPEKLHDVRVFSGIMNSILLVYMLVGFIGTIVAGLFPLTLLLGFFIYVIFNMSGEKNKDYTYDELRIRYSRIRNEYVGMLKKLDLTDGDIKRQVKDALDSILIIDNIINDTQQYKTIFNILGNLFFTANRNAQNAIKEQQLLESLAFNDLFIKSAQLQQ
jgi:hypothetical protein